MNGKQLMSRHDFSQGIFAALPRETWESADLPAPVLFDRKEVLFREGDRADTCFIVESGLLKAFKTPANDRVQIVGISGGGDVVGTEALSHDDYRESVAALTRVTAYALPSRFFRDFLMENPVFAIALIRHMNEECERIRSLLVDLGTKRAISRVASCVQLFMEKQSPEGDAFNLPISRQEMGAFLGLSPETVSRQLKELVTQRVIRLDHKRLTVVDPSRLAAVAQV